MDAHTLQQLPPTLDAIGQARRAIRLAAVDAGLGMHRVDDLLVAASEACTNALEAQIRSGRTEPISVRMRIDRGVLEVIIRDRGDGFVVADLPVRPPLDDAHHLDVERGWGIQLMRELCDEVVIDSTDAGTTVCLRMALSA